MIQNVVSVGREGPLSVYRTRMAAPTYAYRVYVRSRGQYIPDVLDYSLPSSSVHLLNRAGSSIKYLMKATIFRLTHARN